MENLSKPLETAINSLHELGDGDLTQHMEGEYKGDFNKIQEVFNNTVNSLRSILEEVNVATYRIAGGSDQVASASQSVSQGATEQASSLEETSASMVEINSQSRQNADNAANA